MIEDAGNDLRYGAMRHAWRLVAALVAVAALAGCSGSSGGTFADSATPTRR
jgi:hypothetical protein